jgi:YD repeat-containing protein
MKAPFRRVWRSAWVLPVSLLFVAAVAWGATAATVTYSYDALGRLRKVSHDNGYVTDYTFDAAGNRLNVSEQPPTPPTVPVSLTVPASSTFSSFIVSWGSSTGVFTRYELAESSTATFSSQTIVYSGLAQSISLTRSNGTYYYRVRACNAVNCGGYTAVASVVVNVPPPPPNPPTSPVKRFVANCVWSATWTAPVGGTAMANYVVLDTTGHTQTVTTTSANVTCPFNNQNGNYPKNVKACAASGACSPTAAFP